MERTGMNVLLVGESKQGCWHLAQLLEHRQCRCWFARTPEEVRSLLDEQSFRIVLSTRPVTLTDPLMDLLRGSESSLFYSFPIEDSCLWLQPMRDGQPCLHTPALRPDEFMSMLEDLVMEPSAAALA